MTIDICSRCKEEKDLPYRVHSDLLDDRVCLECALAAEKVGLLVELVEDETMKH